MSKIWRSNTLRLLILFCFSILVRALPTRKWVWGLDEAMHLLQISFVLTKNLGGAKPGYVIILTFIAVLLGTQNPIVIRLLTILFSGFLVFVGYSFGKRLGGNNIGLWTAVFLTFHHKIFDLSYWIMSDIPFTFVSFLALYLVLRNFEILKISENNGKFAILAGILCGLSYLIRQVGIYLILLTIFLYFIILGTAFSKKFSNALHFFSGTVIMLITWFIWNYINYGVLDATLSFVDISLNKILITLGAGFIIIGLIALIYHKKDHFGVRRSPFVLIYATSVFYVIALFSYLFAPPRGIVFNLLYYVVQIPGFTIGFHLILPWQITVYGIIISIVGFQIIIIGLVNGYKINKLLTGISIISVLLLLAFLVNIVFKSERYLFPIIPVLTPFLVLGLCKIRDILHSAIRFIFTQSSIKKQNFAFRKNSLLLIELTIITAIVLPNVIADGLANYDYLSSDEMFVRSPLWREYIKAALWFRDNSDPQAKVMTFKNFDFEYYSHRKCIPPSQQIYREYYRHDKQAYVIELMNYMYTRNITHIVIGPFGYTDNYIFWLSDPSTAPSYVDVIYLRQSPKVIIYSVKWSTYKATSFLG